MNIIIKKYAIALFMIAASIAFLGSTHEAKAIGIKVTITFGRGTDCNGRGICSISIGGTLSMYRPAKNQQIIEGDAEIKGDYLIVKLKSMPSQNAMSESGASNGKEMKGKAMYEFPITKGFRLSEDVSKKLGFNEISLVDGNYTLDGKVLKFKIASKMKAVGTKSTNMK